MITEMAIDELNKVLQDFVLEHRDSSLTYREVLDQMSKPQLIQLVAKLFVAANNVVQSRL